MNKLWNYLRTQKLFGIALLLGSGIIAATWFQITSKPYYTIGDPNCATLSAAITTIGSTQTTLVIPPGSTQVGDALTIPATLKLKVEKGGLITVSNGATFTCNGLFEAGEYAVFSCAGTGIVRINSPSRSQAYIRWWGATGDGVTDDTAALQSCFNSFGSASLTGPVVLYGSIGDTYLTTGVVFRRNGGRHYVVLDGQGCNFKQSGTGTILQNGQRIGSTNCVGFNEVRNAAFLGASYAASAGTGIATESDPLYYQAGAKYHGLYFQDLNIGMSIQGNTYGHYYDIEFTTTNGQQAKNDYDMYIYGGASNANVTTIERIKSQGTIKIITANSVRLEQISQEGSKNEALYLENVTKASVVDCYIDSGVSAKTAPAYYRISNSSSIKFSNIHFNGSPGTAGACMYFEKGSRSVTVENTSFYGTPYASDGSLTGIALKNNRIYTINATQDIDPRYTWDGNIPWEHRGMGLTLQTTAVKLDTSIDYTEYAGLLQTFDLPLSSVPARQELVHGCTYAIDNTVGFDDTNSLKITLAAPSDYTPTIAAVIDYTGTPPGSPNEADRYIIGEPPTGAWVGYGQKIATYSSGAWTFATPGDGNVAFVTAKNSNFKYVSSDGRWHAGYAHLWNIFGSPSQFAATGGETTAGSNAITGLSSTSGFRVGDSVCMSGDSFTGASNAFSIIEITSSSAIKVSTNASNTRSGVTVTKAYATVMSAFMKVDADTFVHWGAHSTNAAAFTYIPNDGNWHYVCAVSSMYPSGNNGFTIKTPSVSGNIWVDAMNQRSFQTMTEAAAWAGKWSPKKFISNTVASGSSITLPATGEVIAITGTTSITSVVATGNAGRRVTLKFADVLTFTDGSNLKLAGNFVTSADDTITLVCDGTNWYEVSRSAN